MTTVDQLLGRSSGANSSPKSVLRQIGATNGKLSRSQIDTVMMAMAAAVSELRKAENV